MTFLEAALEILKRERKPLHYKELTEKAMERKLLTFVGRTPLAFAIAGHHGGIPDTERLRERLKLPEEIERYARAIQAPVDHRSEVGTPSIPPWLLSPTSPTVGKRSLEFFTRILFSALTDADFLDTEAYFASAGNVEAANRNAARAVRWRSEEHT